MIEEQVGQNDGQATMIREDHVENISQRKLGLVKTASFDTLIAAIIEKSEKAQSTFLFRLFQKLNDDVLSTAVRYSNDEGVKRAKSPRSSDGDVG